MKRAGIGADRVSQEMRSAPNQVLEVAERPNERGTSAGRNDEKYLGKIAEGVVDIEFT